MATFYHSKQGLVTSEQQRQMASLKRLASGRLLGDHHFHVERKSEGGHHGDNKREEWCYGKEAGCAKGQVTKAAEGSTAKGNADSSAG